MILLDTHVWVWWVADPDRLSGVARREIEDAQVNSKVHISSISAWEVALLVRKGRLGLDRSVADWVAATEALPFVRFVPIDNRIGLRSAELDLHPDPADRMISATALVHGFTLVTKDERLLSYEPIKSRW